MEAKRTALEAIVRKQSSSSGEKGDEQKRAEFPTVAHDFDGGPYKSPYSRLNLRGIGEREELVSLRK